MPRARTKSSHDCSANLGFEQKLWLADDDPACGSGPGPAGFVQSEKFVESHGGKLGDISICGPQLKSHPVLCVPKDLLTRFETLVKAMNRAVLAYTRQVENLCRTSELVLRRLMSPV